MTAQELDKEKLSDGARELMVHWNGLSAFLGLHYGYKLGLFSALSEYGEMTSEELAGKTGYHERWVREWLHQQAASGIIGHSAGQRFRIEPEKAALVDPSSAAFVSLLNHMPTVIKGWEHFPQALRTGKGRTYDDSVGADGWVEAPSQKERILVEQGLPAIEGIVEKLRAGGRPCRRFRLWVGEGHTEARTDVPQYLLARVRQFRPRTGRGPGERCQSRAGECPIPQLR